MCCMSIIWPLFDLEVSTPRVTLRYVTDELAAQLAELAAQGIHDPATMPFSEPWTDVPAPELQRNTMRYYWHCRADTTAERWNLNLAVQDRDGQPIGLCTLSAEQFSVNRTASTGSWLGSRFQGAGLGREMRHAVLHPLFVGLHGACATTRAWHDNTASIGLTRSLPYTEDGAELQLRRDRPDTMVCFSMTRERWMTCRRDDIRLTGSDAVRDLLAIHAADHAM